MVEPRLVREVRSPDGIILDKPTASIRARAIPPGTASTLNEMMQQVIIQGGLTEAEIPGVKVAGKTGTAESGNGNAHSWWITFAPADDPEIAMCVMVENGGRADRGALPLAARLMRAYLEEGV
jgi:peptidoglycan glycosyltransferase